MSPATKKSNYLEAASMIKSLLEDEQDCCLKMVTITAVLKQSFPQFYWVGFYRVTPCETKLQVGPYQGTPACLHIDFSSGVCGTAAAKRRSMIVDDVEQFVGHIACDPKSKSEIVIPVIGANNKLIAVLDIDSDSHQSFCSIDQQFLESLCSTHFHDAKRF